jgi:serine/threonine-protein kinase
LGRGASAEVHDGWDELLQRPVAIKVLHPDADSHWSAERFCEEARTAARLTSPHVVTVHDFASDDVPFLVLERMSGRTWADELREAAHSPAGRADDERTCEVLRAVLDALAEARRLDIVHRDVKPGNVMLTDDGTPKLGDFGIAKSAGGDALTRTGEVLGSFAYVAPERASGQSATSASDIWSVGVMAYEAFTGRRPFVGDSAAAVVHAVLAGQHVPLDELRPDLPLSVRQAVSRALLADPTSRPTPEEFAEALSGTSTPTMVAPVAAVAAPATTVASPADTEATAPLAAARDGAVIALPVLWRERTGRSVALLAAGAIALVLVVVLASQGSGGLPPADASTPPPTGSSPTATASASTPTRSSATSESSTPQSRQPAKAPAAGPDKPKPKDDAHAPKKGPGKGKGPHDGKGKGKKK